MAAVAQAVLCLAYVLGLLLAGLSIHIEGIHDKLSALIPGFALLLLGGLLSFLPRAFRGGVQRRIWLLAGAIAFLAVLHFQIRLPQPAADDVSHLLKLERLETTAVELTGFVETTPRLTRNQAMQFELDVFQAHELATRASGLVKSVSGKVYVTVRPQKDLESRLARLYPGQMVAVQGKLYEPQAATNPGGFDFAAYLKRQGIFAGLRGEWLDLPESAGRFRHQVTLGRSLLRPVQHLLWQVQQRIVRSQRAGLGEPEGALVSAMLLGKGAVDVPYEVRDLFSSVGLAHALAASGFQVSLLVGILLSLTARFPKRVQLVVGAGGLLLYVALTGLEASVARAGLMGLGVLLARTLERKIQPLGAILVTATLLLLWNPLWISDLGFQLSFLATLGLVVTVPVLDKWLDWLPRAIAPLVSVPLAAFLWTLPLQLQTFGVLSLYTIPLNVVTAPLLTLISLGSGLTALVGLVLPPAGSALSWLLLYPTRLLLGMATMAGQLPGNTLAAGSISTFQTVTLYAFYLLLWWQVHLWRYWWLVVTICLGLVAIPAWVTAAHQFQVTVLDAGQPLMVVQHQTEVGIVGGSDRRTAQLTLLPFLQKRGVNQVNWAIAPTLDSRSLEGWQSLLGNLPIQQLYGLPAIPQTANRPSATPCPTKAPRGGRCQPARVSRPPIAPELLTRQAQQLLQSRRGTYLPLTAQSVQTGIGRSQLLSASPPLLQLQFRGQRWLVIPGQAPARNDLRLKKIQVPPVEVLWWSGRSLPVSLLEQAQPRVAIASRSISPKTAEWLRQHRIKTFSVERDGAVEWTPATGFRALLQD